MMQRFPSLLLSALLLGSCSRQDAAPNVIPANAAKLLGYVQVTAGEQTAAQWVDAGLRPLALTEVPEGLDLKAVTTVTPTLDEGNTRYLYATVLVRNGKNGSQPAARSNLTFLAVDDSTTISDTAITNIRSDTGASLNTESVARSILPAHRMNGAGSVNAASADFVAFAESNLAALSTGKNAQPWGFAVRHCLNTACNSFDRTLPGNAAATQYDGRVTFAFKTPKGTTAATTPKTVTALYAVYQDVGAAPRLTQTPEEQTAGTVGGLASAPAGFEVTKFPGSALAGGTTLNSVRTSGTAAAPTAYLFAPVIADPCGGAPGTLDPCFGVGGKVLSSEGSYSVSSMILDNQGRMLVAGQQGGFAVLTRFTANGELDNTFGTSGKIVDFGNWGYSSIALDNQNRIIVTGVDNLSGGFRSVRYMGNGQADHNFGIDGVITTKIGSEYDDFPSSVTIDEQGRVIVVGSSYSTISQSDFVMTRYTQNGQLDASFGISGIVKTDFAGSTDIGHAVTLDSQGRILIAGTALNPSSGYKFALVRYNSNGQLDTSFGNNGKMMTSLASHGNQANSVILDSQQRIVLSGYGVAFSGGTFDYNFAMARYNSSGQIDTTFGDNGKVLTDFNSSYDYGQSATTDSQGRIILSGRTTPEANSPDSKYAIARYTSDGQLDTTFGNGGKLTVNVLGGSHAQSVALDSQGKIIVGGSAGSHIGIIRINP